MVLARNLLRPQMLFHRQWIVGAPFHSRIVCHDHAFDAMNTHDARDNACTRHIIGIDFVAREPSYFQKRRIGICQHLDPVSWQQLAARQMLLACPVRAATHDAFVQRSQVTCQRHIGLPILVEIIRASVNPGLDYGHFASLPS